MTTSFPVRLLSRLVGWLGDVQKGESFLVRFWTAFLPLLALAYLIAWLA